MIPPSPPQIIPKGIVCYCPSSQDTVTNLLRMDVYYSPNNPFLNFLGCGASQGLIWTITTTQVKAGTIFAYESIEDLIPGYYTIKISSFNSSSNKEGQMTVGFIQPTPYLVIGLPYSIYEPITVS